MHESQTRKGFGILMYSGMGIAWVIFDKKKIKGFNLTKESRAMTFSRELIPRLTYAKQMYLHGYEHGKCPGFLNKSLAIISIDGAIERFLWTIITEFNVGSKLSKEPKFPELYKVADDAVGNKLPLKTEVQKIHAIRNGAQHQGTIPSERDIESSLIYAEDFLSQGYLVCFSIKFNEIFLSDLIIDPELRAQLKKVEDYLSKKDYENAAKEAALTFDTLKNKYTQYYADVSFKRGSFLITDLLYSVFDLKNPSKETWTRVKPFEKTIVSLLDEIDRINDRIYAISLGANMQDYLFFRKNTPRAKLTMNGFRFDSPQPITYSEEKTVKILNFLQNIIIHWESLKA